MKFIIALFALIAVASATSLSVSQQITLRKNYQEVMQNKGLINTMASILCAIVCEPFQVALDTIINLGLQVILSLLALPPDQIGSAFLAVLGK